jgi:hypothetical protein
MIWVDFNEQVPVISGRAPQGLRRVVEHVELAAVQNAIRTAFRQGQRYVGANEFVVAGESVSPRHPGLA